MVIWIQVSKIKSNVWNNLLFTFIFMCNLKNGNRHFIHYQSGTDTFSHYLFEKQEFLKGTQFQTWSNAKSFHKTTNLQLDIVQIIFYIINLYHIVYSNLTPSFCTNPYNKILRYSPKAIAISLQKWLNVIFIRL